MKIRSSWSGATVLVAALAIVAASFFAATLYFSLSAAAMERETGQLLSQSAPSSRRLALSRTALHRIDRELDRLLLDALSHRALDEGKVTAAEDELHRALEEYRRLPRCTGDEALAEDVFRTERQVDEAATALLAVIRSGDLKLAEEMSHGAWSSAVDAADHAVRQLVLFHVEQISGHGERILQLGRDSVLASVLLGCFNLLLTIAAAVIAVRSLRRQARLQQQRMEELSMFSSRVAHDILSPLSAVSLSLVAASRKVEDPSLQRQIHLGQSSLGRVQGIVDGLLTFARSGVEPDRSARCAVPEVVGGLLEELRPQAEAEHIELVVAGELRPVAVACPQGIVTVLVSNLVRNAMKFMGEAAAPRRITVSVAGEAERVRFEVRDTGPGVPAGMESAIFDPYVRGPGPPKPGLGLGLATVKRFAEAYGGSVGVLPAPGGGSTFWFELPRAGE